VRIRPYELRHRRVHSDLFRYIVSRCTSMVREQRNSRQKSSKNEQLAFHWHLQQFLRRQRTQRFRKLKAIQLGLGIELRTRRFAGFGCVSVCASCFQWAIVYNVFLQAATMGQHTLINYWFGNFGTVRIGRFSCFRRAELQRGHSDCISLRALAPEESG